jgi:predicted alpha/beta hydrolase family esterase
MTTTLIVPGLHSSGPDHWQTWFEQRIPGTVRVIQRDWRLASLPDWASRVRREIDRIPGRLWIVAHSFGALAAVQAAEDHNERIAGAMLVAPADPEKFGVADYLPDEALAFRTVVVASTNDDWMRLERAAYWADRWAAELVILGAAGHINAESGFGPWPEGLALFERLRQSADVLSKLHANQIAAPQERKSLTRVGALSRASTRRREPSFADQSDCRERALNLAAAR